MDNGRRRIRLLSVSPLCAHTPTPSCGRHWIDVESVNRLVLHGCVYLVTFDCLLPPPPSRCPRYWLVSHCDGGGCNEMCMNEMRSSILWMKRDRCAPRAKIHASGSNQAGVEKR